MDNKSPGKTLAVDWGSRRIGLAISDESRTLARPLTVLRHTSRADDARRIVEISEDAGVSVIIVGVTYAEAGELSPSGRTSQRLAAEIESQSSFRVVLWDEEFTTRDAQQTMIDSGAARSKRSGHMDDKAAAFLLQSYLDSESK